MNEHARIGLDLLNQQLRLYGNTTFPIPSLDDHPRFSFDATNYIIGLTTCRRTTTTPPTTAPPTGSIGSRMLIETPTIQL